MEKKKCYIFNKNDRNWEIKRKITLLKVTNFAFYGDKLSAIAKTNYLFKMADINFTSSTLHLNLQVKLYDNQKTNQTIKL